MRVTVNYQDPSVKPLTIEKHALDKLTDKSPSTFTTFTRVVFFYEIRFTNPGPELFPAGWPLGECRQRDRDV